ncbi:Major facilitator superfamily (MFS) profile domain-containing protein [Caenorhabditis elegans]|uniref:Major facilitator superfamily (MFS) profile domain-containing protein n=2 Tax=Caenorhabditis elegans TaxID=6239 RepID=H2KZQ1_CAEEL|nr:Major facilitator superfamily (MFS) profile domain-containing protein [Caenorhabditis elegans]CCD69300.1 Major facilitator superfamily (MFS) profile domain-containing protein [Caenorhabditis elegans]|eukprot:NP_490947.2 SLC (SoLute Carrier) homolog [Caenorhabditis elegans]
MPSSTYNSVRSLPSPIPPLWTLQSIRFQTALLISAACVVFGLMRTCFGMAMVDIVRSGNGTFHPDLHMEWSGDEQANIHTSFYIGAFIAVFPSEFLAKKLGPKNLLSFALLLNIFGSLLTPFSAIYLRSYFPVAAIRLIMGFGYGFVIPAGSVLISSWFPLSEKSTAMAIFTTGNQIGIAVSMFLTAKLCQLHFFEGWPLVFIVYGLIGAVFLVIWHVRLADKPRESKYITATELTYIKGGKQRRNRAETIVRATPYMKIILNGCVCAICACSFAQSFVLVALVTYLPKYNQIAFKMNLTHNGIWSSLPFFIQMITKLLFAIIADKVKQRKVNATAVTKVSNAIASFASAIFIVIAAYGPFDSAELVQLSIIVSMAAFSAYVPGYNTSIVTVAPQFTAFISSYAQLYAQIASTLAPIVIGRITSHGTIYEWKCAFYSLAGVLAVTGLIFQIFGHGRTEPWGETPSNATSARLSTSVTMCEDGMCKLTLLEKHNHEFRTESKISSGSGNLKKKVSRVSYAGEEIVIPGRIEDLENDVIYSIEEERED